jgi:hypothetical protein
METSSTRSLVKSPLAFARMALAVGRQGLENYSCAKSPHVFTQPQLFAMLAFKHFLNVDYRGVVKYLNDWPNVVTALGLKRLPNFSTLKYAQDRFTGKGASQRCLALLSASLDAAN